MSSAAASDRVFWSDVPGERVLEVTIAARVETEARATLRRVAVELVEQRAAQVLLLVDLRAAAFLPSVALEWQRLQKVLAVRCRRIAAVGAHGTIATAAKAFLAIATQMGHPVAANVQFFDDDELARAWLVEGSSSVASDGGDDHA